MTAIASGLQAAFRLARGEPDGIAALGGPGDPDMLVAQRSFAALAACVPLEFAQGWLGGIVGHALLRDVMVAVVGWLAFALVSHKVAGNAGRAGLWPRYIAAWNWCSLLQSVALLLALAVSSWGPLPDLLSETLVLVAVGWAVWLEFFVARVGLGFNRLQAMAMVALDFAISQVINLVMQQLG